MLRIRLTASAILLLVTMALGACSGGAPQVDPTDNRSLAPDTVPEVEPQDIGDSEPDAVEIESADDATPTSVPEAGAGEVIVNETLSISAPENAGDSTQFTSPAGQTIRVRTRLTDGTGLYEVNIRDKFDNFVATLQSTEGETEAVISELTLPFDGQYDILVEPIEGTLSVELIVTVLGGPSGGGPLGGIGESLTSTMAEPYQFHLFTFSLTEGGVVTIGAVALEDTPLARDLDLKLSLLGPDGTLVAQVDDVAPAADLNAVVEGLIVPLSGEYVAIVSNVNSTTGDYQFRLQSDTEGAASEGDADIVYNAAYQASFTDGDSLTVSFNGTIGDVIQVEVTDIGANLDLDLYVYGPFDQIIGFAASSSVGDEEVLNELQLPYTGQYQLELRPAGFGNGAFTITRLDVESLTGGGVFGDEASGTRPGQMNARNVFHMYQFNGSAGDTIDIIVTDLNVQPTPQFGSNQTNLDVGFAVLAPNGTQLAFADSPPEDEPVDAALENFRLEQSGSYIIVVYSFSGTGQYELSFSRE